jgi:predicted ATPase
LLSRIHLTNFQGYKGPKSIDLAPLTLIFGPNSGGKSSVIRSMLLLKQSLAVGEQSATDLNYVGQSVNLVGFPNVAFGHNTRERMTVGFEIRNTGHLQQIQNIGIRYEVDDTGIRVIWLDFDISVLGKDRDQIPEASKSGHVTVRLEPQLLDEESESLTGYDMTGGLWRAVRIDHPEILDALNFSISSTLNEKKRETEKNSDDNRSWVDLPDKYLERGEEFWKDVFSGISLRYLIPNERGIGIFNQRNKQNFEPDVLGAKYALTLLLTTANSAINMSFQGLSHLDPLREIPDRIEFGKSVPNSENSKSNNINLKKVSGWVEMLTEGRFSLDSTNSELSNASFLGNVTTRLLIDNHSGTKVSFQDVGVGLSQVEPILAALNRATTIRQRRKGIPDRAANGYSTLLIQQPELHLHPKMQSDLMNVFVEAVSHPNARVQIIAETHSENMVLRLQKKIRQREISVDQVSILYAEKDSEGEGNRIVRLELDNDGQFVGNWPLSFLDIRLDDLL